MRTIHYSSTVFCKIVPLPVLLSFSTGSAAQVFKCVDQATGKTRFTDKACPDNKSGDYLPVRNADSDAGYDANATADEKQNRDAADNAHRKNWEQHIAQANREADRIREQKEGDKNNERDQVEIDRVKSNVSFENSMAKKQCSKDHSIEYCRRLYD